MTKDEALMEYNSEILNLAKQNYEKDKNRVLFVEDMVYNKQRVANEDVKISHLNHAKYIINGENYENQTRSI